MKAVAAKVWANRTFTALRVRNYRLFATGSLVSNVGTWMQRVAQDWLVLKLTDSGAALGITTGLQFLPMLLFSPMAGVVADRFPKRRVLMVTQVAMGISAAALGVLAISGVVQTWHVYVLAFVFGTATAFDSPARQAFVNEMVEPSMIVNAVGLNSASFNLARMIGPAVAGAVIALLGSGVRATGWVILLNAISYVSVLYSLSLMRSEEMHPSPLLRRARGQLGDGLRYVRNRPDILLVLGVVFCAGTFGLNFQLTTALMATEVYGMGAGEYGILGSVLAIGSLAGALVAARRTSSRQRLVVVSALAFGVSEIVAGLMPSYLTFALFLPVCGFAGLTVVTAANSFVQMATDAAMRGRVMALYMMIFMGGTPAGAPLLGWVADHLGARWTLIGGGALTALGTIVVVLVTTRGQGIVPTRYVRPRHGGPDTGELAPVVGD
ncbi:MFS transporter [Desertimonas flava]|uniref:MFS transporter n=1 Tax=Desertimonas flava TaxID=2064846 RepID=UPI000E352635|nr:MFS transporter [Desertimonas flava]